MREQQAMNNERDHHPAASVRVGFLCLTNPADPAAMARMPHRMAAALEERGSELVRLPPPPLPKPGRVFERWPLLDRAVRYAQYRWTTFDGAVRPLDSPWQKSSSARDRMTPKAKLCAKSRLARRPKQSIPLRNRRCSPTPPAGKIAAATQRGGEKSGLTLLNSDTPP